MNGKVENFVPIASGGGAIIKAWIKGLPVAESAIQQLRNLAMMPFIFKHLAVMPDYAHGKGATVGSVFATKGAVIPAAVGVDLGCGMLAVKTNLVASDLPADLSILRAKIESLIPHGRTDNGGDRDTGAWRYGQESQQSKDAFGELDLRLKALTVRHPALYKAAERAPQHMGTLGTGNHFVEVCLDESDNVWIMLHSGSRGIGNKIGTYFIQQAQREMKKWYISLPDPDLAYLAQGTDLFREYLDAADWAQEYAVANRRVMMMAAIQALSAFVDDAVSSLETIDCHHNYVAWEKHFGENVLLTRKGAISAQAGELGIIPGSMGERSFIVRGKGNRESFCSSSHGAGRLMSRTEALKTFTVEQHIADTAGVECAKDISVLDETPRAYKNIDDVMRAQEDNTEIVHTLKQIVCVKGHGE